jgi:hypothetical protein
VGGPTQTGGFFLIHDVGPVALTRQGHVIDLACPLDRDEAVLNVAADEVGVAFEAVAVASAAR